MWYMKTRTCDTTQVYAKITKEKLSKDVEKLSQQINNIEEFTFGNVCNDNTNTIAEFIFKCLSVPFIIYGTEYHCTEIADKHHRRVYLQVLVGSEKRRDSPVDGDTYHKKEDEHGA